MPIEIPSHVLNRPSPVDGRVALIDGDILVYRAAFACQRNIYDVYYDHPTLSGCINSFSTKTKANHYIEDNELKNKAVIKHYIETETVDSLNHTLQSMYDTIMAATLSVSSEIYLTSGETLRHRLAVTSPYKAGRPEKPVLYKEARQFLLTKLGARHSGDYEADDMLAIRSTRLGSDSIICSIDKDLRQVPGYHYSISTQVMDTVTQEEAWRNLFKQALVGDVVDNIKGCKGVGPKKAELLINECKTPREAYHVCYEAYIKAYGELNGPAIMYEMMDLVYLKRGYDDGWELRFDIG